MIPFNRPYMSGRELKHIREAHAQGHLSGNGPFTKKCERWLEKRTGVSRVFLSHSGTAALEMAAILAGTQAGDEIVMPSYAFVSCANAFVLRGGMPVFVDIRPDTFNIDERLVESALTRKTKAIVAVHYGGIACDMDALKAIAHRHGLFLVEDAAQGVLGTYKGKPLGSLGDFGIFSFHETKSLTAGEGGALLLKEEGFAKRAEMIREEGTNRSEFLRGKIRQYTWRDIGSSYLPSDMIAAFLWGQLEQAYKIIARRHRLWRTYDEAFQDLEKKGKLRRPVVPKEVTHNAHLYYLLLEDQKKRDAFIRAMAKKGIHTVFHYVPLHHSLAGNRYGRVATSMKETDDGFARLVRLPLWIGVEKNQSFIIDSVCQALK